MNRQATWHDTLKHWLGGVRFYIAIAIVLITFDVWWWVNSLFAGSSLFAIRIEETYAWLAVGFLFAALLIGPAYKVLRSLPGKSLAFDARRLFGVGAAWFASLHASVAYIALFKLANPLSVPGVYRRAFLVGGIAGLILLAMAFTSFDAAFNKMGQWWFRLHRLVYIAAAFTILHAFMIGTHAATTAVLGLLAALAVILLGLHCVALLRQSKPATTWQLITVTAMTILLVVTLNYGYSKRTQFQTPNQNVAKQVSR